MWSSSVIGSETNPTTAWQNGSRYTVSHSGSRRLPPLTTTSRQSSSLRGLGFTAPEGERRPSPATAGGRVDDLGRPRHPPPCGTHLIGAAVTGFPALDH